MSKELSMLLSFMEQLGKSDMVSSAIAARAYDYALLLCRVYEEKDQRQGTEFSTLRQIYIMDHAADLLKFATDKLHEPKAKHDGKLEGEQELRLETCAMCGERYKQEASRWHCYKKSPGEEYIFCSYEHLDQWAKEHKEWVYKNG